MKPDPSPPAPLPKGEGRRTAFTVIEMVVAFAIMGVALVFVSKVAFTSMKERGRNVARQTALEHANNILESARAIPWGKLTPAWAAALKSPEDWKYILPEARLEAKVEPEKERTNLKRVAVTIRWLNADGYPVEVRLETLFAARNAVTEEDKK